MSRKRWFVIAGIILVVAISYAGYYFFIHKGSDILAVSAFNLQAESVQGQQLWVKGRVTPGSVNWDDETRVIKFVLSDNRESLDIIYEGTVPDDFRPGADLEIQGSLNSDGIFVAQSLGRPVSLCGFCH
ncbi:MAG: cytochrome c maturation protein CcmE [Dehalococcoidales bacterium]